MKQVSQSSTYVANSKQVGPFNKSSGEGGILTAQSRSDNKWKKMLLMGL